MTVRTSAKTAIVLGVVSLVAGGVGALSALHRVLGGAHSRELIP